MKQNREPSGTALIKLYMHIYVYIFQNNRTRLVYCLNIEIGSQHYTQNVSIYKRSYYICSFVVDSDCVRLGYGFVWLEMNVFHVHEIQNSRFLSSFQYGRYFSVYATRLIEFCWNDAPSRELIANEIDMSIKVFAGFMAQCLIQ